MLAAGDVFHTALADSLVPWSPDQGEGESKSHTALMGVERARETTLLVTPSRKPVTLDGLSRPPMANQKVLSKDEGAACQKKRSKTGVETENPAAQFPGSRKDLSDHVLG